MTSSADPRLVRRRGRLVILTLLTLLILTALGEAQTVPPNPRLVISPPGDGLRELFENPGSWVQARALTGSLLYADHNLTHFSDAELRSWFEMMRGWGLPLELEVGAIKEWGLTADEAFNAERHHWDRALRLGAVIGSIAMDEPLAAARSLHKSDAYAMEQTVRFIGLVRQHYPEIRIGDIEPYPGVPLADHVAWLENLQARLREQNIAGLDFYRVDIDWVAFARAGRGSWREVYALAQSTQRKGVPLSVIYWAAGYPSEKAEGVAGDDTWYVEVLGQGYAVRDAGIKPDQFVLESWLQTPPQIVPESGDYTFTRSVLDFARKFAGGPANGRPDHR